MLHRNRLWSISPVDDPEELAQMLTERTWCLCSGFEIGGYWFLNDATSEDGAQEYAVVKINPGGTPRQVESITMSWCTLEEALDYIQQTLAHLFDNASHARNVTPQVEPAGDHDRCHLCA